MDLSGMIFVALAVGWAVYLIPKALRHHDELAESLPVDTFSDSVRVLGRPAETRRTSVEPAETTADAARRSVRRTSVEAAESTAAARKAARRRRRVLGLLLLAAAAVVGTCVAGYTPWWSTAIPGGLIVVFLVVARVTVRAERARRAASPVVARVPAAGVDAATDGTEDTEGIARADLDPALDVRLPATAEAEPLLDDGALWDPLPMTLPTYVSKARARRTVRTVELTGMTSSGHDDADSTLARQVAEQAGAVPEAGTDAAPEEAGEQRRVAGA